MTVSQNPASAASPWSWARVVYAVLALTVFCFPGGMVDWLDERNASGWLAAPWRSRAASTPSRRRSASSRLGRRCARRSRWAVASWTREGSGLWLEVQPRAISERVSKTALNGFSPMRRMA